MNVQKGFNTKVLNIERVIRLILLQIIKDMNNDLINCLNAKLRVERFPNH
jgi:hypothetical protein